LNKHLADSYIELVKTNSRVIKAFAWGGAKQIFKTKKDLPEKALKSLYVVILE
jgi:hypothetical protein